MKNYLLLLAVAATVSFSSCDNDDDDVKSKTELLTANSWKYSALTISPARDINGDGIPESDLLATNKACNNDDIFVYKTDKTYTEEEGATKCDPADPQVYGNGTWAFNGDETILTTTASTGGTQHNFTITELSDNTLKYTETFTSSGTTYTTTATFTH